MQLPGGRWISEKDPGYPYLAVAFGALGLIRLAPSVGVSGAGVAVFDTLIYGGPLRSGYRPGEITFSLGALGANLRYMPAHLIQAMPMLVLGLAALAGIAVTRRHGQARARPGVMTGGPGRVASAAASPDPAGQRHGQGTGRTHSATA